VGIKRRGALLALVWTPRLRNGPRRAKAAARWIPGTLAATGQHVSTSPLARNHDVGRVGAEHGWKRDLKGHWPFRSAPQSQQEIGLQAAARQKAALRNRRDAAASRFLALFLGLPLQR